MRYRENFGEMYERLMIERSVEDEIMTDKIIDLPYHIGLEERVMAIIYEASQNQRPLNNNEKNNLFRVISDINKQQDKLIIDFLAYVYVRELLLDRYNVKDKDNSVIEEYLNDNKASVYKKINRVWKGLSLKDRFKRRDIYTQFKVLETINRSIGEDIDGNRVNIGSIMDNVMNEYNKQSKSKSSLVITEKYKNIEEVNKIVRRDNNIKELRYHAVLDDRVCDDCSSNDGKIFKIENAVPLPRHPRCRCFYSEVYDL